MTTIRTLFCAAMAHSITIMAAGAASPVDYHIKFTPTWIHPNFSYRSIDGKLTIDQSGLGQEVNGNSYAPGSWVMSHIVEGILTLNDGPIYSLDPIYTSMVKAPPISRAISFGLDGNIVDIEGVFRRSGTLSEIILGRDGFEGTYVDVQQIDPFSSVAVSRGNYFIHMVPEPVSAPVAIVALVVWLVRRRS